MRLFQRYYAIGADYFGGGDIIDPIFTKINVTPFRGGSNETDVDQIGAIIECRIANVGDTIRDGDALQAGTGGECGIRY